MWRAWWVKTTLFYETYSNDQILQLLRMLHFHGLQIPILAFLFYLRTHVHLSSISCICPGGSFWLADAGQWRWWCKHSLQDSLPCHGWFSGIDQGRILWVMRQENMNRLSFVHIRIWDTQNWTDGQVVTGSTWLKFCHSPSCRNDEHTTYKSEHMEAPGLKNDLSIHGVKLPEQYRTQ